MTELAGCAGERHYWIQRISGCRSCAQLTEPKETALSNVCYRLFLLYFSVTGTLVFRIRFLRNLGRIRRLGPKAYAGEIGHRVLPGNVCQASVGNAPPCRFQADTLRDKHSPAAFRSPQAPPGSRRQHHMHRCIRQRRNRRVNHYNRIDRVETPAPP
jgi:hypothetical protein